MNPSQPLIQNYFRKTKIAIEFRSAGEMREILQFFGIKKKLLNYSGYITVYRFKNVHGVIVTYACLHFITPFIKNGFTIIGFNEFVDVAGIDLKLER